MVMGRYIRWAALLVTLCAVCPRAASAGEPDEEKGADETFHEGRALLKDKRYGEACPKFEESQRKDPASGTLLALAYCQELSGLLATSWTSYLAAAQLAEREGHPDRQASARERAATVATRVSKLTVVVPPELLSLPGFHLLRDGFEFERASFGMAVPTDGGTHAFQASAPGRVPWTSTVTLLAEHDQKTLILPVLDLVQAEGTPVPGGTGRAPTPPLVAENDSTGAKLTRAGWVVGAASLVGLGIGTAFTFLAVSKNNQSNQDGHCNPTCDATGTELRNSALSAARVSTWSFVAGGALAVCSVTLFVAGNAKSESQHSARLQGGVSLGAPSLSISGSF